MTIGGGETASADDVLRITKIDQIYTGSGFNNGSFELTAVPSSNLESANYAVVKFTGDATSATGGGSTGNSVTLLAEIKETGQSYADIVAVRTINKFDGAVGSISNNIGDYTVIAALTAGMRTNGFQVRLTGVGYVNIQTTLEVKS